MSTTHPTAAAADDSIDDGLPGEPLSDRANLAAGLAFASLVFVGIVPIWPVGAIVAAAGVVTGVTALGEDREGALLAIYVGICGFVLNAGVMAVLGLLALAALA